MVYNALPISIPYETIRKIKLVNPHLATIVKVELLYIPFYF